MTATTWTAPNGTDLVPSLSRLKRELRQVSAAARTPLAVRDDSGELLAGEEIRATGPEPIVYGRAPVAWLHGAADASVLAVAARHLSAVIESEVALRDFAQQTARQWQEINFLTELGHVIDPKMTPADACVAVLDRVMRLLTATHGAVFLPQAADRLALAACRGFESAELPPPYPLAQRVFESGEPLLINAPDDRPEGFSAPRRQAFPYPVMLAPLSAPDQRLGVLAISSPPSKQFMAEHLKLFVTACNQAAVAVRNTMMVADVLRAEQLQRELQMAAEVQRQLLPQQLPTSALLECHGLYRPAGVVSGDYFDAVADDDGSVSLVIGDVSGHGLGPALFMSNLRSGVRALLATGSHPSRVAVALNRQLAEDAGDSGLFVTAALARCSASGQVSYVNCGHPDPLVVSAAGEVRRWSATHPPLGMVDRVEGEVGDDRLEPGDLVVFYSDALIETENGSGDMFGIDRVMTHLRDYRNAALAVVADSLVEELHHFAGGAVADDLTLLLARRGGR